MLSNICSTCCFLASGDAGDGLTSAKRLQIYSQALLPVGLFDNRSVLCGSMTQKTPEAKFIAAFGNVEKMPAIDLPEFAFIGRSNVGKSSLINMLCIRKNLAHISSNPGKTQSINLYDFGGKFLLTDLPGYGYARVSKTKRVDFEAMMRGYFSGRPNLCCAMVLIDSRIPPQKSDLNFLNWLGSNGVPVAIVYTKADKKNQKACQENVAAFREALLTHWESLPLEFITSAREGSGRDELLGFLNDTSDSI
jgi:GTP-binding protein